jgi:hypothetical protein
MVFIGLALLAGGVVTSLSFFIAAQYSVGDRVVGHPETIDPATVASVISSTDKATTVGCWLGSAIAVSGCLLILLAKFVSPYRGSA